MKTTMNTPLGSKINWTALLAQILTLLVIFDFIPQAAVEPVLVIVGLVSPTLIQIWRTWFTEPDVVPTNVLEADPDD